MNLHSCLFCEKEAGCFIEIKEAGLKYEVLICLSCAKKLHFLQKQEIELNEEILGREVFL